MTLQSDSNADSQKGVMAKSSIAGVVALLFLGWALYIIPAALWMFESTVLTAIAGVSALLYLLDRTRFGRWLYRFTWNWFHWDVQMPPWNEIPQSKWRGWVYNQPLTQKITVASVIAAVAFVLSFIHLKISASLFFQLVLGLLDVPASLFGFLIGYGAHHLVLHHLPFIDSVNKLQDLEVSDISNIVKSSAGSLLRSRASVEPKAPVQSVAAPVETASQNPPQESFEDALARLQKGRQ